MTLVDTSVIADIFTKDPDWFRWSSTQIERAASHGPVAYNAMVFACLPLPLNAAFQAGKAFEKYRRAGGTKARPLPDFFIGAHAYVAHLPLLTRDPRRVRTFFPSVRLITP